MLGAAVRLRGAPGGWGGGVRSVARARKAMNRRLVGQVQGAGPSWANSGVGKEDDVPL